MDRQQPPPRPTSYDKKVALVLQGGGALGSYQAGVYEALAQSDYLPDWVAGISIGAINAAIIAGNPPDRRVERLRTFWEQITAPTSWWPSAVFNRPAKWERPASAMVATLFGQPGFFQPRWSSLQKSNSYYDTAPLKRTLEQLVDFDRINHPDGMRFSVGAANVRTGRLVYFDSAEMPIRVEHVMASGALPPAFPPVEIDGEFYWDGGLVSNTPLQYVLDYYPRRSRLAFQVDLFQGFGPLPCDIDAVTERQKDIRYSSRTRVSTDIFHHKHEMRHAINEMFKILPDEFRENEQAKRLYALGCVTEMDIVQIIYRPFESQGATKDHEFSRGTMNSRWALGRANALTTLQAAPWLAPMPQETGVRIFDVLHDILVASRETPPPNPAESSRGPKTPVPVPMHTERTKR